MPSHADESSQRERGFAVHPYPCIGLYRFSNLTLLGHPAYATIVERLKSPGASYLDIGCCFGQDLRQLVQDGVPSENLTGLDIEPALMEVGHELFLDRDSLRSRFVVADVLKGAAQGKVWTELEERGFDVIHCSAFFHLFTLEDQATAAKQMTRLVKNGGMIVGRQMGSVHPEDLPVAGRNNMSYRHDVETLRALWKEVGEATQTRWEVEGSLDMVGISPNGLIENQNSRRLLFAITRVE